MIVHLSGSKYRALTIQGCIPGSLGIEAWRYLAINSTLDSFHFNLAELEHCRDILHTYPKTFFLFFFFGSYSGDKIQQLDFKGRAAPCGRKPWVHLAGS